MCSRRKQTQGIGTCPSGHLMCWPDPKSNLRACYTCLPPCYPSLHLSRPTLDTLGRMFLHLSLLASLRAPCSDTLGQVVSCTLVSHLSPCLLHLSPLASGYSGNTWPELSLACLLITYSWPWPDLRLSLCSGLKAFNPTQHDKAILSVQLSNRLAYVLFSSELLVRL